MKYACGDKAGVIAGYTNMDTIISGCSVTNSSVSACRDVGGIVGAANGTVKNCSVDTLTVSYIEGARTGNAGSIIGRRLNVTESGNQAVNVTLPPITGTSISTLTLREYMTLKDLTVETSSGAAIVVDSDVTLTIDGTVTLTGATNGIEVPDGFSQTLTGANGSLVVKGGSEVEGGKAGSGIGNIGQKVGSITIDGLKSLTAEGNGTHAFGIGGNVTGPITIENTTIEYVKGGFVQATFVNDPNYGSSELEGGAAIGVGGQATVTKYTAAARAEGIVLLLLSVLLFRFDPIQMKMPQSLDCGIFR